MAGVSYSFNILSLLGDLSASADKVFEENISHFTHTKRREKERDLPCLSDWISILHKKAERIVEGDESASFSNEEVPSLMVYLRGSEQRNETHPRVSSVLSQIQRMHLHRNPPHLQSPVRSAIPNVKMHTHTLTERANVPTFIKKPPENQQNVISSHTTSSSEKKLEHDDVCDITPFSHTQHKINNKELETPRSSKRKSSLVLALENIKKPKTVGNSRIEKKREMNSPLLVKSHTSVGLVTNVSVLKEKNRTLQIKQDKAVENKKNTMSLRQQKLDEKRTQQEKMENKQHNIQHLKNQTKTKLSKLRSNNPNDVDKNQTRVPTHGKVIYMKKIVTETTLKNNNDMKTFAKEKKKLQTTNKMGTSTSVLQNKNEKTPPTRKEIKNFRHETEKVLNTTYVAIAGDDESSNKVVNSKGKKFGAPSKSKTLSHTQTPIHAKGTKTVKREPVMEVSPQKKLVNSTITSEEKKGIESYALTPAHSSFVSYDISEIRSDSEEEEQANSKPIPSWATGVRLRNALLQQHHHPIDTDELFGNVVDLPDLVLIMGVKKKNYNKRTSSAVWNSFSFS